MSILNVGNVVKSKTSGKEMIIKKRKIDKPSFNQSFIEFAIDGSFTEPSYIYTCPVQDEEGAVKMVEFKREELIFVRSRY